MANAVASGPLYQLLSAHQLGNGAYVAVNGPFNTHGVVIRSTPQDNGQFLNLIRGCAPRPGVRVVASF